jgi:hypothetical protein
MKSKLFIPQPIPEAAISRLAKRCDVTMYPHVDRRIPYDEVLAAVHDQDILYALGEIPYDAPIIDAAVNLKLIAAMHASAPVHSLLHKGGGARRSNPDPPEWVGLSSARRLLPHQRDRQPA